MTVVKFIKMGLLTEGSPLTWEETRDLADHVREHGITQFINLYHKLKDRQGDFLKWGDEVSKFFLFIALFINYCMLVNIT